jgi:hypothetical protein
VSVLRLRSKGELDAPLPAVDSTTLRACVCVIVASVESSVRGVDSTTLRECVQVIVVGVELSVRGVDSTTLEGGESCGRQTFIGKPGRVKARGVEEMTCRFAGEGEC